MKSFILGVLGGLVGSSAFYYFSIEAFAPANAQVQKVIQAQSFQVLDKAGKIKLQLSSNSEDQGSLFVFDNSGKVRLTLGLYSDQTGSIVLNDKNGNATQILRSFGPNEAPLHIFKTNGTDMMISGLNPSDKPTPFLMYYDSARKRTLSFGKYDGP